MSSFSDGRAVSNEVGDAEESGTWICKHYISSIYIRASKWIPIEIVCRLDIW